MRPTPLSRRYAEAAFDVARQDGDVSQWLRDLRRAADTLRDEGAVRFFKDPNVTREQKIESLDSLFTGYRPHVMNLLRMLAARERLHLLSAIVDDIEDLDRADRGISEAFVVLARPVEEGERDEIARLLTEATGKTMEVHTEIDPSIIGGIVLRIGDRLIDASVAGRLERLRHELAV